MTTLITPATWDNTTVCFGTGCPNCERDKQMTPITPATDEEIALSLTGNCDCGVVPTITHPHHVLCLSSTPRILARIEADRAKLAEQAKEIERLRIDHKGCGTLWKIEHDGRLAALAEAKSYMASSRSNSKGIDRLNRLVKRLRATIYEQAKEIERLKNPEPCVWQIDGDDLYSSEGWRSMCDYHWVFEDGGPNENQMRFCVGCGHPVKVAEIKHEREEE